VQERQDLQRLLRDRIQVVADDVMVIAEEYGAFQDSRRRIDLLGLDRRGCLVVIELKRTEDGGHVELQALRYAAMVSAMTLENVMDAHEAYLERLGRDPSTGRAAITGWLAETGDEASLSNDIRILLVSANFDTEITTTVLWLNSFDRMDIRCIRLVPYLLDERLVLDVQQIVPLPEAADYQVRIREKELESRMAQSRTTDGRDWTAYVITTPSGPSAALRKRRAVLYMVHALHRAGISCEQLAAVLSRARFVPVEGDKRGEELMRAFQREHPGIAPGWWFLADEEVVSEHGRTWVLSKRWNRHSVEQALTALAGLGGDRFRFDARPAASPDPAETA
jgi:hypothetical protein